MEGQFGDYFEAPCSTLAQNEAVDPSSFEGHALQKARVVGEGSRAKGSRIIFCSGCRAYFRERASALCKDCSLVLGGRSTQLCKIRAGISPHPDFAHWTILHVRRPALQEASSRTAVLGREVQGNKTPKRRRLASATDFSMWSSGEVFGTSARSLRTWLARKASRSSSAGIGGFLCS